MSAKKATCATKTVLGQPSWHLKTQDIEAWITEAGGHLAPVTFDCRKRKLQPYHVAPWAEEKLDPALPQIIKTLRGDFFCMPFGGNAKPYKREQHPVHGETANAVWHCEGLEQNKKGAELHLSLKTKVRPGRVDKTIRLVEGQPAIYCRHVVSGMSGPMNFGHHAMLRFPDQQGSGLLSTSAIVYGQVYPGMFERPDEGGYQSLRPGADFMSLDQVPLWTGGVADLTRYPARRGFEDLVMVVADASSPLAWTAVTFPQEKYVWFALKDPRVLRETVFWLSNGGRHYPPWNGRHVNVLGLEEVTSGFHGGLAESVEANNLTAQGYQTYVNLEPARPLVVNYIMACLPIPAGFDRVAGIAPADSWQSVRLTAASGKEMLVPLDVGWLQPTHS